MQNHNFNWRSKVAILLLMVALCSALTTPSQRKRLPKGYFLISGAAGLSQSDFGVGVLDRFVALAGGPDANYVYIPTASSGIKLDDGFIYTPPDSDVPADNTHAFEIELAKMFGVKRITIVHSRNRQTANQASFVEPLRKANAVWISGGNSGRLADAYLGTLTEKEIKAVAERGGVVGGN